MQGLGFHSNDRLWYHVVTVNLKKIHKYSIFPLEFFTRRAVVILWLILGLYMKFKNVTIFRQFKSIPKCIACYWWRMKDVLLLATAIFMSFIAKEKMYDFKSLKTFWRRSFRNDLTAISGKLFEIRLSYKHCNFTHGCLLVKMAPKTVTRSIDLLTF